jgi:cobalt-zinc-cadmium efflux system outer membrane protein
MRIIVAFAAGLLALASSASAQEAPPTSPTPTPTSVVPAQDTNAPAHITLEDALRLAVQHNHALLALRSTILQNQAQEITANLRPNPNLAWDAQFIPLFSPSNFNSDYFDNNAQFDIGASYLFERGKKRQHRLQAAKDATSVTRAQVSDSERTLIFNVAQQFINVILAESTLQFARQDLDSFQNTVNISDARFKAGAMSEGDFLKIKLQLLQFQTDVSTAKLNRLQALASLRQFLGFESVPDDYEITGDLDYQPEQASLTDLRVLASRSRPDLLAAQEGVTAARSQETLARANGKQDLTAGLSYSHTGGVSSATFSFSIPLAVFDRNQGEIARTGYTITQAQETAGEITQQVSTDVLDAYENLHTSDQIVQLYRGGYVDQAKQSRDISEYAYRRGAASLLDFLDAERTYRANQLAYRQALANYMLALEQLRQAVGTRNLP